MTTLLLLHGLGATSSVWDGVRAVADWDGDVLSPDLPGHGTAARLPAYGVADCAAALGLDGPVAVLGHSFGGAIAVALASQRHGGPVTAAVGLGIKAAWTREDVEKMAALAAQPARVYATRDEALRRHVAIAGLRGEDPAPHEGGVVEVDDGWVLAIDPRAFAQVDPELPRLVAEARCPVALLRGELDPMVSAADLPGPSIDLPGLGHNAHVEDPAAVWTAVAPLLR